MDLIRFRISALQRLAKFLNVPVTIHEDAMRERMLEPVRRYVDESVLLLKVIWGASTEKAAEFDEWAWNTLSHDLSNHALLHRHPLYFSCYYAGGAETDQEMVEARQRFAIFCETESYAKMVNQGWRVNFGLPGDLVVIHVNSSTKDEMPPADFGI